MYELSKLTQIRDSFPSEWIAINQNNDFMYIRFYYGLLMVFENRKRIYFEQATDYYKGSLDTATMLLKLHKLIKYEHN